MSEIGNKELWDYIYQDDPPTTHLDSQYHSFMGIANDIYELNRKFYTLYELKTDDLQSKNDEEKDAIINEFKGYAELALKELEKCYDLQFEKYKNILSIIPKTTEEMIQQIDGKTYYAISCCYKDFCQNCRKGTTNPNEKDKEIYCKKCSTCTLYEEEKAKTEKQLSKKNYKKYIENQVDTNVIDTVKNKLPNKINNINVLTPSITINNFLNPTINLNDRESNILYNTNNIMEVDPEPKELYTPYISTKDHYFHVNISFPYKNDNILEKIKYIFTYLMCGKKGKELFPNEPKHSLATSFPLVAALYTIKYIDDNPTLYGLLRYKHVPKQSTLTIAKLKNIGKCQNINKTPIVNVTIPNLWKDNKHHYCVLDMTNIIENIIATEIYYGSDIKQFYTNDVDDI